MKRTCLRILCLLMLLAAAGCTRPNPREASPAVPEDFTAEAWRWADSVAGSLDRRELAAQVLMPAVRSDSDSVSLRHLSLYIDSIPAGGVILLKGDAASARRVAQYIAAGSELPPFVGIDAEWGLGMRITDAPSFPVNADISPNADESLLYDYGRELAREARLLGINVIFAPVLDVDRPQGGVMRRRSFGSDPERVASLGTAFARGLEDGNVISVAKHFPGHGAADADSHRTLAAASLTRSELDSIHLKPFRRYIDAGLSGVMVGHLWFASVDSVRRSAVVSPEVITSLLRERMGFKGLVFTDAINMQGLGKVAMPVRDAILAGADIILAPPDTRAAHREILSALADGSLPEDVLRERCRRILFFKYSMWAYGKKEKAASRLPECLRSAAADSIARMLAG